jgi:hypothetical protein
MHINKDTSGFFGLQPFYNQRLFVQDKKPRLVSTMLNSNVHPLTSWSCLSTWFGHAVLYGLGYSSPHQWSAHWCTRLILVKPNDLIWLTNWILAKSLNHGYAYTLRMHLLVISFFVTSLLVNTYCARCAAITGLVQRVVEVCNPCGTF